MNIENIWSITNGKLKHIASDMYEKIMEDIRVRLKMFDAVLDRHYGVSCDLTSDEVHEIYLIVKKRLEEDNYVFDIQENKYYLSIRIYLLEKTEEQYKEIEDKMKNIKKKNFFESFYNDSAEVAYFIISYIIIWLIAMVIRKNVDNENVLWAFIVITSVLNTLFGFLALDRAELEFKF